ncbi:MULTISPECIES: hypothetical protein [unclassified Marinitoga]|uniref:hypothetical protein n=1 Tax=unclassified Marinitoga TaxID=2640159 RepID=UPI0006411C54|nr:MULTISPECIES: hypothetical protein [unclassified Marinitoga]KLO21197.1 hypothetical protein X274_10975 [Marinitoga sp. 1155]NUU99605.1 hypothetical protein [Marinitoga sp. 1154]
MVVFKSNVRYILNIISYILLIVSIIILTISYFKFQNRIYLKKIEQIKINQNIIADYKTKIDTAKRANEKIYNFLDFLEQIKAPVYIQSIEYTPSTLSATILIEIIDGLKIVSPYQIKEIGTLDLLYKQYKILELKK